MSYTRSYREQIAVHYSGSVGYSYPASQNGGSGTVSYSGTTYEDVSVYINVDTNLFDNSVEYCNSNVNLLTGAVVATEAAQIASIDKNSKKVAGTIINGFFGYIRSEISQQIAELTQGIDSQLMHLKELSRAVGEKKRQMESDFFRISSRYVKIFDDLNKELSNRIFELDKPTFHFKKELDSQNIRSSNSDLVNTVAIFGKEAGDLQSKIRASLAKKRAFDTLKKSKYFLWQQQKLNNTIQKSILNETLSSFHYLPVCFIETIDYSDQINKNLYTPQFVDQLQKSKMQKHLINQFLDSSATWSILSNDLQDQVKLHFNLELNKSYSDSSTHSERVKKMIQKIADIGTIQTLSIKNTQN